MVEGSPVPIRRLKTRLHCDASHTIARFFWLGDDRAARIVQRVAALPKDEIEYNLEDTLSRFNQRHDGLERILARHADLALNRVGNGATFTPAQRLLVGAMFTMEYAYESAALFNPSMVPAVDQSGLAPGEQRFVMSLRAVGEGHVSSIVFRRGMVGADGEVMLEPVDAPAIMAERVEERQFEHDQFLYKLIEMGGYREVSEVVLGELGKTFSLGELRRTAQAARASGTKGIEDAVADMLWLADSNYQLRLPEPNELNRLVIYPISVTESQGIEDMRLVQFTDDEGKASYLGTYTAYDGRRILPQLMEVSRPDVAEVHTLHGLYAQNKGMALFPRLIEGRYAMIGRADGENLFYLDSTNVRFWNEAEKMMEPLHAWESVQIGNCGSPIETDAGWLLLTHGVGPMRRYCIGAVLLDRDDPKRVIGRLREPLLAPGDDERDGYVPNVVYSCGGMLHGRTLVLPYGISDAATGFALVELDDILAAMG